MKLNKRRHFYIAKNIMDSVFTQNLPLNYLKWIEFVEDPNNEFIWKENTEEGQSILRDIKNIPDDFRSRVLGSLNKVWCFKGFDTKKKLYNISAGFNKSNNWITIQFATKPKIEELHIFLKMANYLDAYLLNNGKEKIDESYLQNKS